MLIDYLFSYFSVFSGRFVVMLGCLLLLMFMFNQQLSGLWYGLYSTVCTLNITCKELQFWVCFICNAQVEFSPIDFNKIISSVSDLVKFSKQSKPLLLYTQAKFQALLVVAVFIFKIEFWIKNAHPQGAWFFQLGVQGCCKSPGRGLGMKSPQNVLIMGYRDGNFRQN